ncbi:hypothetical protein D3C81_523800 [compost metagenome]
MFTGELIGHFHHVIEGFGLVVGEISDHRHHRTITVEQFRVVHRGLLRAVVQHVLVARDGQHFRVAFIGTRRDLAHRVDQRHGSLHARLLLQQPAETIGFHQGFVLQATFAGGFDHDRKLVAGQRIVGSDVGVVAVVT